MEQVIVSKLFDLYLKLFLMLPNYSCPVIILLSGLGKASLPGLAGLLPVFRMLSNSRHFQLGPLGLRTRQGLTSPFLAAHPLFFLPRTH
jgi:hypothetical protein